MSGIRRALPVICISSLFIVVFNVAVFALTDRTDKNFWCGYIFITLSWICLIVMEIRAASDMEIGRSIFFNAPGLLITIIHLAVQTVFGIAVMAIPFFSVKLSVCIEITMLAVYLGMIGSLEIYKGKSS